VIIMTRPTRRALAFAALPLMLAFGASGQNESPESAGAPAPPSNVGVADHAWDNGTRLDVTWALSPDDPAGVDHYEIEVAVVQIEDQPAHTIVFTKDGTVPAGVSEYVIDDLPWRVKRRDLKNYADRFDVDGLQETGPKLLHAEYSVRVTAVGGDGARSLPAQADAAIAPTMQMYDAGRFWFMITLVMFCGAVVLFIYLAKTGIPLKVRKIAGLEAVDEAVGRATEMGRPCLFVPGIQDMNDIQTIAGINVLARVSRTAAQYDAKVEVPTARSLVMTTARETVKASYLSAGRPDAYNEDLIYYVTDEQFGYVAYLQGMMVREKPAACFYMGTFYAESLILAETGNSIGAIQIAGTAMPAQLPFFVAACDYTLIGEEFFAASAYLTGSPEELGSLKGQDVGKLLVGIGVLGGVAAATVGTILIASNPDSEVGRFFLNAVAFFKEVMLT